MNWVKKSAAPLLALSAAATAVVLATPASAAAAPSITLTPSSGVANGGTIAVKGTGFKAGASLFILECWQAPKTAASCDVTNLVTGTVGSDGSLTASIKVKTGTIGTGTVAAGGTGTVAAVDNAAGASDSANATFTFAGGSTTTSSSPTTTSSSPTTSTSGTGGTTTSSPTSVNAGSGGNADKENLPAAVIVLAGVGAIGLAAGAYRFSRR